MSRRRFDVENDENQSYVVVGWDRPLHSFFFQVWNGKDESRMAELEDLPNDEKTTELADLYEKYDQFGGEPIIKDDGCLGGPTKITTIEDLQKRLEIPIPIPIKNGLLRDKELQA